MDSIHAPGRLICMVVVCAHNNWACVPQQEKPPHWETLTTTRETTHSSVLTRRIPWTEEPSGLQSTGPERVRHDWATNTYCTRWGIWPIFYNYKWSTTFKNCESLYCTPVTYIILYINCTLIKREIHRAFRSKNRPILIVTFQRLTSPKLTAHLLTWRQK